MRDRARLTIDLDAVVANWRMLVDRAPRSEVAAVVKADAYGLGAARVVPALARAGCRTFFVAQTGEAVAVRAAAPEARVLVLHGIAAPDVREAVARRLVPVLNEPGQVAVWRDLARRLERRLPVALHLDTGMNRLGLAAGTAIALDGLVPVLVMSHLVSAEIEDDPLNEAQRQRFERARAAWPSVPASLANSSGLFLGAPFQLDLCRPGYALYGGNPLPGRPNPMRAVVRLDAPVLQVTTVAVAGSVGYNATFAVRPGMRIATVPVGYADGWPRSASNKASVRIGGAPVPIAGRVSMDLITLDVSHLPESAVRPGTSVEMLGEALGIEALAEAAGTNGYEILTRLGRRYERRYRGGDL